jgi:RecB family exonuclease
MAIGLVKAVVSSFGAGARLQGQIEVYRATYHLLQSAARPDHSPNGAAIDNFARIATPAAVAREQRRQDEFDAYFKELKESVWAFFERL